MTGHRKVGLATKRRNCRRLISEATGSTHFFRIMLPSVFQEKRLRIPKKFIKRFGDELSSVARLAIPDGCFHGVKLKKVEDEIYFKDGWCEFVEDRSICVYDLLVFNYKGNSKFDVLIFDVTTTEICYLCNTASSGQVGQCPVHHDHEGTKDGCDDDHEDNSVEILGSSTPPGLVLNSRGNRKQITLANFNPASLRNKEFKCEYLKRTKKLKIDSLNDQPSPDEDVQLVENGKKVEIVGISCRTSSTSSSKRKIQMTQETERAIKAARTHQTKNPSFIAVLTSHNAVTVPVGFASELQVQDRIYIKLRVSDGREWRVRYIHRGCTGKGSSISKGWAKFVSENRLKQGDVCVFELIQITDIVLRVLIFSGK